MESLPWSEGSPPGTVGEASSPRQSRLAQWRANKTMTPGTAELTKQPGDKIPRVTKMAPLGRAIATALDNSLRDNIEMKTRSVTYNPEQVSHGGDKLDFELKHDMKLRRHEKELSILQRKQEDELTAFKAKQQTDLLNYRRALAEMKAQISHEVLQDSSELEITNAESCEGTMHTLQIKSYRELERRKPTVPHYAANIIHRNQSIENLKSKKKSQAALLYWRRAQFYLVVFGFIVNAAQNEIAWKMNLQGDERPICLERNLLYPVRETKNCPFSPGDTMPKVFPITKGKVPVNLLRGLNSLVTILVLLSIERFYVNLVRMEKDHHPEVTASLNLRNSPFFGKFCVEIGLCILHVPAFIEEIVGGETPVWLVILTISPVTRMYTVIVFLYYNSRLPAPSGIFIGKLCNLDFDFPACFRIICSRYPFTLVIFVCLTITFIGAYALMVSDNWYCGWKPVEYCHDARETKMTNVPYFTYDDAIWLSYQTFVSVGFGEIKAKSICGRIICVLVGLSGRIILATITASISKMTSLVELHGRVHSFICKSTQSNHKEEAAAIVIQSTWSYYRSFKNAFDWQNGGNFEMKVAFRSSHEPFERRLALFDAVRKFRSSRGLAVRFRLDLSGHIYKLDLCRKSNLVMEEIMHSFDRMSKLVKKIGVKRSTKVLRGGAFVRSLFGPPWLQKLGKDAKKLEKSISRVCSKITFARAKLDYAIIRTQKKNGFARNSIADVSIAKMYSKKWKAFVKSPRSRRKESFDHDQDECVQGGAHIFGPRDQEHSNCYNCQQSGWRGEFDDGLDWCIKCHCCQSCCEMLSSSIFMNKSIAEY